MTLDMALIERLLGSPVVAATPLAGGDLSAVTRLTLADGRTVVAKPGATAPREAAMLHAIAATGAPAPEVLAAEDALLLLDALPADGGPSGAWDDLAHVLGRLHAARGPRYGWEADHAFGRSRSRIAGRTTGRASGPTAGCAATFPSSNPASRAASSGSPRASPSISRATRPQRCSTATSGAATSSPRTGASPG